MPEGDFSTGQPPQTPTAGQDDLAPVGWQAPLIDVLCGIVHHRTMIVLIVALGVLLGVLKYANSPYFYRASTVAILLSREKPSLDASIATGSLETSEDKATRESSGALMLPPNIELYTTLMGSRPVVMRIAEQFEKRLTDHLKSNDRSDEIVMRIKDMIKVSGTEEGLLTIEVTAHDPELASDIANAMVDECMVVSKEIERQLILQQAGHLDKAVSIARENLQLNESALKQFAGRYTIIDPMLQAGNTLRSIREAEALLIDTRAKLSQRLLHHTASDPQAALFVDKEAQLKKWIEDLRKSIVGQVDETDYARLLVEYQSLQKRVEFGRDLVATLSIKSTIFRIRAEQPAGNIAVIRKAVPSNRPAGPGKKKTIGIVVGLAIFLAIGLALLAEQWKLACLDPYVASRLKELKEILLPSLKKHLDKPEIEANLEQT